MDRKILVVEDEAHIRENLRDMLEAEGYVVVEAADGDEGVSKARSEAPDLVVCDVTMPGRDGWSVLAELRSRDETLEIPVLFLTALADRESRRQGMEMGAEDYITKPFTRTEILAAVEARIRRSESLGRRMREQFERMRQVLSRSLPHEILTPLNGIMGLSSMLVDEYESMRRDEVLSLAQGIASSGENLHRLVRRFLLFSEIQIAISDKAQASRMRAEKVADAPRLVEQSARQVVAGTPRESDFQCVSTGGVPAMHAAHLELVVQEMVLEGLRRSRKGHPLRLVSGPCRDGWRLGLYAEGANVDPAELARIRAGESASDGMGLGLSVLRAAAELYRGRVSIDCSSSIGLSIELLVASSGA
jgi:CheY-like chemotaxis protein